MPESITDGERTPGAAQSDALDEEDIEKDTETGSMSADTAALGGGAIAGADTSAPELDTDADGGAR